MTADRMVSAAEVAKDVKTELLRTFPGKRFRVRCVYRGGNTQYAVDVDNTVDRKDVWPIIEKHNTSTCNFTINTADDYLVRTWFNRPAGLVPVITALEYTKLKECFSWLPHGNARKFVSRPGRSTREHRGESM